MGEYRAATSFLSLKPAVYGDDDHRCETCGRNSPPSRAKCQYCGGHVATIEGAK